MNYVQCQKAAMDYFTCSCEVVNADVDIREVLYPPYHYSHIALYYLKCRDALDWINQKD